MCTAIDLLLETALCLLIYNYCLPELSDEEGRERVGSRIARRNRQNTAASRRFLRSDIHAGSFWIRCDAIAKEITPHASRETQRGSRVGSPPLDWHGHSDMHAHTHGLHARATTCIICPQAILLIYCYCKRVPYKHAGLSIMLDFDYRRSASSRLHGQNGRPDHRFAKNASCGRSASGFPVRRHWIGSLRQPHGLSRHCQSSTVPYRLPSLAPARVCSCM